MKFIKQYKWLIPLISFTASLLLVRVAYTRSLTFAFVPWNLLLAVLPLYFSYQVNNKHGKTVKLILFCLWLLFFPNAMYIITDLFHLHERQEIPQWYDLLILFSAALNGVIMGMASLHGIEVLLLKAIKIKYVPVIIFLLFLLCGYGIYLGRYLRLNSWDIITRPFLLLSDIRQDVIHPFRYSQSWMVSILFATWLCILYKYFKKLGTQLASQ